MTKTDLRQQVLRLKILQLLRTHASQRQLREAALCWRQLVRPN